MTTAAVVGCRQLVTLGGPRRPRIGAEMRELSIIEDGAFLVAGGVIERTGSRAEIEPLIPAGADVIDAGNRVALPGFVDAHTHPVFAGNRAGEFERRALGATYAEIAAEGGGIRSTVRQTRAAPEAELLAAASRYARWFVRGGTTTIEAKSGYGLSLAAELKLLRVIGRLGPVRTVATFLGAHEVPDEYRSRRAAYLDLVLEEMLPAAAAGGLARYCDVFCEPGVFPIEDSRRVLTRARELGLGLRLHADQLCDSGGARLAAELGAATADHLEHTGPAGFAALRAAGVQPVLLPGSVYALGSSRFPQARAMIDAGLAVVLATDFNPGSSPTPSMPLILSLACTHLHMAPSEAITAATVNAAYSLGLGREIGTIEAGKNADFVLWDCADYREIPYFFGVDQVFAVYIGGRVVN